MANSNDFDLGGESETSSSLVSKIKAKLIYFVVGILVLVLAAFSTVGVISLLEQDNEDVLLKEIQGLKTQIEELSLEVQQNSQGLNAYHKVMASSDASSFRRMMIRQEQSYQLHLGALKQGMYDLAKMIPGSRTWLEIYNEQMDAAITQSNLRVAELEAMQLLP